MLLGAVLVLAGIARALPERMRDPIAASMRRTVVAPLIALQESAELTRNAIATHEARTAARDSVALQAMSVGSLERENERLRQLLGLARQLRWGFVPAEALHTRGIGEEFQLTLTAGSNAGVRAFSPVIAPEGLVGMVKSVDPTMSTAIIWPHPDFRVSAMAADGSAFGIVAAHLGGGPERYLLEMRGVQYRNELDSGTVIVSSGLGGVYPRGIPIGVVLDEVQTQEGWARTYLLRPAVLPPDVASVMILRADRAAAGVENVWARAGAADSAGRRVAAAADSIARRAAAAESTLARAARAREAAAREDSAAGARTAATPPETQPTPARPRVPIAGAAPVPGPIPPALERRPAPATTPAPWENERDTGRSRTDTGVATPQRDTSRPPPAGPRSDTTRRDTTPATDTTRAGSPESSAGEGTGTPGTDGGARRP